MTEKSPPVGAESKRKKRERENGGEMEVDKALTILIHPQIPTRRRLGRAAREFFDEVSAYGFFYNYVEYFIAISMRI